MRFAILAASIALLGAGSAAAATSESLTASFLTADGGVTVGGYDNQVRVTVSGVGQSLGSDFNDAFYVYDPGPPSHDPNYYQLTFGTSALVGFDPAQDAVNDIVGGLPAYNPDHIYSFILNTGATTPTALHFGVGDGNFSDNSGEYWITVTQLGVPEPATWAIMLAGFGGLGAALRQRRRTTRALA